MKKILVVLVVAAAFAGGFGYGRWYGKSAPVAKKPLYWVDPMHPWYKSDKPGIAPDCGMALVAVYPGDESKYKAQDSLPPGSVEVTPEKRQLIGVQYGTVNYESSSDTVRAAARITLDETRVAKVQSKIEGWIDEVFADFTGKQVKKGEPLLTIYSPEALATQQEYLLAVKARSIMRESPMARMDTTDLVETARRRLELWDIGERQLEELARTGKPLKNLTLYAPLTGYVMERNAYPKQRVTQDAVLYTLADLSRVWAVADVFEYEAASVRVGQAATLTLAYLPGRTFRGRVSYILPQVDPATRTLKVRVEFDNPGLALKPDMYGEVELRTGGARRLVVPQTAVLNSGDRQTVYMDLGNGYFEPRAVKIGRQIADRVEILSGLQAGEKIVISGNFLIDSESQLKAASK
jgi:membrane fusion protein, copper/silver efflux system